jgi:uncharacterized protein YqgV (UPF0045/DUF77 family)
MGTIVETDTVPEALRLVERAHAILDTLGCDRVYATIKLDVRRGLSNRIAGKVDAVRRQIGDVAS